MNENLKNLIEEYVLALPQEIQEAMADFDWADVSLQISEENELSEEEANDLQTETALVLIGLTRVEDFLKNIEDKVGITNKVADNIARHTFDRIFQVISDKTAELIKNKTRDKKLTWDQNIKFILTGGDYMSLLNMPKTAPTATEAPKEISTKKMTDLKDKFVI